jgi:hypothetical protein
MKFLRRLFAKLFTPKYTWTNEVPKEKGHYWYRRSKADKPRMTLVTTDLLRNMFGNTINQWSQRIEEPKD